MLQAAEDRQTESLRVLIVDDHDLFRTGLRNLLEEQGVVVVGEAAGGAEAVRIVRELAPDVVVMDMNVPGLRGRGAARHMPGLAPARRAARLPTDEPVEDQPHAVLPGIV